MMISYVKIRLPFRIIKSIWDYEGKSNIGSLLPGWHI